ncbi:mannose-1-phosphate guanylyltransferase/mannose-6-phosphate isomerase [Pseudoalteromonas luteoviolacea]|uniref:mannose-1-phosphate guanylyltransferase n=1 Tax=Pseudoalteromonas luteoviolacea H33 TaxID=1365251 RepID=A0A167EYV6_9GAMM|nr:mannose-1-phosphate guanylyltransferase/mannose-6-phosphate isomerase [Pseudoalteromonas luteoviolacea]KZN51379.1 mannose-1-phosphate guanyltransferase [Pseudoalteromonas luteoviolacea H33]KZN71450.1 mannose-1-phosphate guanyltransferase [Pseudoalteromonas luteoviolacea H33-S]
MILPVIMAGGSGSRLWPLSRGNYPKQFLKLNSEFSMLQETCLRLEGLNHLPPLLICNEEHRFLAAEQIRLLKQEHSGILLEPFGRNTAPAVAIAAIKALDSGQDPLLLVLAADHVIQNPNAFKESVSRAKPLAEAGQLVTFGIVGDKPETGYGYIRRGSPLENQQGFIVDRFVEKPSLEIAEQYIDSGEYYWNSGMFLFKASKYLKELKQFRADIYEACIASMNQQSVDFDFIRLDERAFSVCPDESIDYAVMEKTKDAVVVPMDAGWNDVGGFKALWETATKDEQGNAFSGDIIAIDTEDTYAYSDDKLIATVGVKDLVVVSTKDAVLVAHKEQTQKVKSIVQKLKSEQRSEATFHREVYRPWGKYDSVDSGERFQVKRITVKPGAKLSVQMHHHRAEHWIVVSGTAKVQIDDTEQFVTENESVYIPITAVHALENPGKVDLELIEVQSGSYLGEDDIVRFQDRYGRVTGK